METLEELQRKKLELEIEELKRKKHNSLSKFDKEFLITSGFVLAGNILGGKECL